MTRMCSNIADWAVGLHRFLARLHGMQIRGSNEAPENDPPGVLVSAYTDYAEAVVKARDALRALGKDSKEFKDADVASMRLFHKVKKAQGLKMPKRNG